MLVDGTWCHKVIHTAIKHPLETTPHTAHCKMTLKGRIPQLSLLWHSPVLFSVICVCLQLFLPTFGFELFKRKTKKKTQLNSAFTALYLCVCYIVSNDLQQVYFFLLMAPCLAVS